MKFATPDITALEQYDALIAALDECSEAERVDRMRHLCRTDLFFLVRYVCNRPDLHHPFFFERCRELQAAPDGYCDLWAREHGKSSLGTFGLSLFHIVNDPEVTIGIFSHTRPIAKSFLRQIKRELEVNEVLKGLFPEVFWENPAQQASKWSEDDGLVWKREGNPKESGLEAWGLVDGMPTGRHFRVRVYDDVVVPASVSTPEMVAKTTEAFQLSDNLGSLGGSIRVYGTRYSHGDSYEAMLASGMLKPRIYACTKDGTDNFAPENCGLMPPEVLIQKRQAQGPYVFAAQLLLNPAGDTSMGFRREWLAYMEDTPHAKGLSVYLIVDPAHSKKKGSDYHGPERHRHRARRCLPAARHDQGPTEFDRAHGGAVRDVGTLAADQDRLRALRLAKRPRTHPARAASAQHLVPDRRAGRLHAEGGPDQEAGAVVRAGQVSHSAAPASDAARREDGGPDPGAGGGGVRHLPLRVA